jgi:Cu/Ag efflux protein CusF
MKKLIAALILAASFGTNAFAADEHEATGTVNSIDKERKTLNITHGPIKTMGMAGMTMDFAVSDPAMLNEVKPGQKIEFVLTTDKKGRFVIVDLQ